MPDFPAYTRAELVERAKNLLRTRRRGIDVDVGSDYDLWSRILGALAWGEQKWAESVYLLLDPRKAFGAFLEAYARECGVGRDVAEPGIEAAKARGKVILLAQNGAAAQTQLAGATLRHADGTEFTLDADATTSGTSAKTFYAGHLSTRSRIYQGHLGAGFVDVDEGEVYVASGTGELCAVKNTNAESVVVRYLIDLHNPLERDVVLHDAFAQQNGAVAAVTAKVAGARGNKEPKERLTLVSPTGLMLAEAAVLTLSGGADAMTPAEIKAALAALLSSRMPVGTLEDLRALAVATPGTPITQCYVTPGTLGLGTYTLLPVRADGAYVGPSDRSAIVAHVQAHTSPTDRFDAAAVYEAIDTGLDVLSVQVAEIYQPDWALPDDSVPGLAITSATVTTLTFGSAPPIRDGDRLVVTTRGAAGPYLVVRRASLVDSMTVTLDEPLPFPPDVGDAYVTPGGALAEAIIDALYAAYAARAPSAGADLLRYPPPETSDETEALVSAIARLEGVLDAAYRAGSAPDLSAPGGVLLPQCVLRMYA